MHDKKMAGEAGWFQSLKGIRSDENLEAIQSVEEHAKLILMQLVNHELSVMGEKMVGNMRKYGFNPDIFDLDYTKIKNLDGWGAQSVANLKYSIELRLRRQEIQTPWLST